jgi:hypothetical protein
MPDVAVASSSDLLNWAGRLVHDADGTPLGAIEDVFLDSPAVPRATSDAQPLGPAETPLSRVFARAVAARSVSRFGVPSSRTSSARRMIKSTSSSATSAGRLVRDGKRAVDRRRPVMFKFEDGRVGVRPSVSLPQCCHREVRQAVAAGRGDEEHLVDAAVVQGRGAGRCRVTCALSNAMVKRQPDAVPRGRLSIGGSVMRRGRSGALEPRQAVRSWRS